MKNEVGKRVAGDILFEPPEPLFPEEFPKMRRRFPRLIVFLGIVALAVCVLAVTMFLEGRGGIGDGESEEGSEGGAYESEAEKESTPSVTEPVCGDVTEAFSESETESNAESESKTVGEDTSSSEIKEVDLSQIEKGEEYVVSYSGGDADIGGLIHRGFLGAEERGSAAPVVLVLHTHTSEGYLGGDSGYRGPASVVSVGDVLVSSLNQLGVTAVHCTVIHDGGDENAYLNAQRTVRTMLEIYPSIRYVIDLHRIGLGTDGEVIKTVSGCSDGSAQIRLTVGSYNGDDSWQEDLALALALRGELNGDGRRLCMPVVISPSVFGLDLSQYYIMVDVGASGNTVEEAMTAGKRLASAFADVVLE